MEKWEIRPPLPQKPLNRSSPKFAWVITSGTPIPMQNVITIQLPPFPQICENAHQSDSASFLVLPAKTPAPIFTINASNDAVLREDVPFWGSRIHNFTFRPYFPPKRKFFANFRQDVKKALTMAMLTCKLPLIVIVAQ